MEEKPKRRLLTMSTGQADPTGVKRPFRAAFRTSQQREAFSRHQDGIETTPSKLSPLLQRLLCDLTASHQDIHRTLMSRSEPGQHLRLFAHLEATKQRATGQHPWACNRAHSSIGQDRIQPIWLLDRRDGCPVLNPESSVFLTGGVFRRLLELKQSIEQPVRQHELAFEWTDLMAMPGAQQPA